MSEANAVATRTTHLIPQSRYKIPASRHQTSNHKADYVLGAHPETIFRRIGPWLDQQPDEIPYDDLKKTPVEGILSHNI